MIDLYILGASGSIGRQTIDIISNYKDKFRVVAMSVGHDLTLANKLCNIAKPSLVCLRNKFDKISYNLFASFNYNLYLCNCKTKRHDTLHQHIRHHSTTSIRRRK